MYRPLGTANKTVATAWTDKPAVELASRDTDASIAEFEIRACNLVRDVEVAYWDLFVAYRELDTATDAVDDAIAVAAQARANLELGTGTRQELSQATEQYYQFRGMRESTLAGSNEPGENVVGIYGREQVLRNLLGLAVVDSRLIRPSDEPKTTASDLDWDEKRLTMLTLNPELRLAKSRIEQRELELELAKTAIGNSPHAESWGYVDVGDSAAEGKADPATESSAIELTPPPLSMRRDLPRIRSMSLRLAREKYLLNDQSRTMVGVLSDAFARSLTHYQLAMTHSQRCDAADHEVQARHRCPITTSRYH